MPKTRQQKEATLKNLAGELKDAKSVLFIGYHGLNVPSLEKLRRQLRETGTKLEIIKKTILQKALVEANLAVVDAKELGAGLAVLVNKSDEVAPAKALALFKKENEVLAVYGGIMENKFIDSVQVASLAKLLGREELQAKIVGSLNAPLAGLVNVLVGNLRGLVNVLQARSQSI